jgi:transcriptional regulator with XRE-family HTH domain
MGQERGRNRSGLTRAVAAQIRAERAASGLTQQKVVDKSGIPKSTYIRLESGERVADVQQLAAFCAALDIPLAVFMQRAEDRLDRLDPEAVAADALSQLPPEAQAEIAKVSKGLRPKRDDPPAKLGREA